MRVPFAPAFKGSNVPRHVAPPHSALAGATGNSYGDDDRRRTGTDRARGGTARANADRGTVTAGRFLAAPAQGGPTGLHRGLCPASGGGATVRAGGAPSDGAARSGRLRQDGSARPLLPGVARTRHGSRLALARRTGRAGGGRGLSHPGLRAGRGRDLRSERPAERGRR